MSSRIARFTAYCNFSKRKELYISLVLLLAVILLLLQSSSIPSDAGSSSASIGRPSTPGALRTRDLLQRQGTDELLTALSDDDDPFAGAHTDSKPSLISRFTALLPRSLTKQLRLLGGSMSRAVQEHSSGRRAQVAAQHQRKQHHRVLRHNNTHTWFHSPLLQLELPQPWDTINLTTIVRDNLEPDVAFWRQLHRQPTVQDILDMATSHPELLNMSSTSRLVEVRNNRLRFPLMPQGRLQRECDDQCDPQLQSFVEAIRAAVEVYNLTLPDTVFIVNTNDAPVCSEEQVMREICLAPVISLSKDTGTGDLVGPVMRPGDAQVQLRHLPWQEKLDQAFFRGAPSCGHMPFPPSCARSWVARMAQVNNSADLDAGLVERYDRPDQVAADPVLRDGHGSLPVLPRVPMDDLPKYKYLLNLDGHTAAYRLGHLLASNSLVLKQESTQVEFYYRSLRPFHHYVPILKHSEHDLLPRLHWARIHEEQVSRIVRNANTFAMRYVTYPARVMYWKYVLLAYRSLIADMDDYFKPRDGRAGSDMESLLKRLAGLSAVRGTAIGGQTSSASSSEIISVRDSTNQTGPQAAIMRTAVDMQSPDPSMDLDALAAFAGDDAATASVGGTDSLSVAKLQSLAEDDIV